MPVCVGIGVGIYFSLLVEPPLWLGMAVVATAIVIAFAVGGKWPLFMMIVLAVAAVFLGFAAAQWRTVTVAAPVLAKRLGPTMVSGRVVMLETFPKGSRVTLDRPRIKSLGPELTPEKIRLRLRGSQPQMYAGDWISFRGVLSPPPPPAAPGSFDFQRQSYFKRLGGVGFAYGSVKIIARGQKYGIDSMWIAVERFRQGVADKITAKLQGPTGTIAVALMTGKRSAIPQDIMENVRDSGLAHLLAISGLHIGLVAGIIFVAIRACLALVAPLALRYPIKKWAAFIAITGAFAYALVAGATVPSQRAFMMIALVLLAIIMDRRGLSMRLVCWAATVILIFQPESILGASFQMSFAAVTALIAAYEFLRERRFGKAYEAASFWRYPLVYVAGVALTTLIAGMATAPFALYHFNHLQVYGLAANLLAVPVTALWTMPFAVVSFLLMPLGLEGWTLTAIGWGVDVIIKVAANVSSWPGAVTVLPSMPIWGLVTVAMGGIWLCLWRQNWRFWGVVGLVVGMASIFTVRPADVLVDGKGRLLAVKTLSGGMAVSSMRVDKFDRKIWLRRAGLDDDVSSWPRAGGSSDGRLSCDYMGCIYRYAGQIAALVRDSAAINDDCRVASVVISTVPLRYPCPSAHTVIDRFDLWRDGGHALWFDEGGVRVQTVNGVRGNRPWVIRPKKQLKNGGGL